MFAKSAADTAASIMARLTGDTRAEPALLTLAQAAALLARVGLDISSDVMREYASGRREPRLPAVKDGKTWKVTTDDVQRWSYQYLAAPRRGRRGDGSVRRRNKK